MKHVHFLSQHRPGPRMGMGHYERLLLHYLLAGTGERAAKQGEEWRFSYTYSGRDGAPPVEGEGGIDPRISPQDGLGWATERMQDWPYPIVKAVINSRFRRKGDFAPGVFHSLALTFPTPTNRPSIYTIHDLPPARFSDEGRLVKWRKDAMREADLVMTPSQFSKRELMELLDLPEEKLRVIPYGLEHERFNTSIAPAPLDTREKFGVAGRYLIYAGGCSQRKNVPSLLAAWKIASEKLPDVQLLLCGPDGLKTLANESGAERVLTPGYVNRDVLPGLIKSATALVVPSIYEGFGMPPQEAMAMGVPVIGTKAGGAVPEVIGNAGLLAEDGSPEAIAGAIEKLLGDDAMQARFREDGPRQAQTFSWPAHAREVLDIYDSFLR